MPVHPTMATTNILAGLRYALGITLLCLSYSKAQQNIDYLPHNEELEIASTGESSILREISCPPVDNILRRARLCQECVLLKVGCPDCCLASPSPEAKYEALKCASKSSPYGTDPALNCYSNFRFGADCPQAAFTAHDMSVFSNLSDTAIPKAQRRGCPNTIPDGTIQPILPTFTGCGPYFTTFNEEYFNRPAGSSSTIKPTTEYAQFVGACTADADSRELCAKKTAICSTRVCSSGYDNNCVDANCKTRLTDWEKADRTVLTAADQRLECWALLPKHCLDLSRLARACLAGGVGSQCLSCFKRVYANDEFFYKFVPSSGQRMVFLWKLFVTSTKDQSQNAYFYSKVLVEDSHGRPVYSSPVHQRVFEGSFSIFSAISVPNGLLETGNEYFVRLYYFISSDPSLNFEMKVDGAEITAVKVRE